jgi:nitroimidazol reductase NimA-like FMN-containing flavoprotein (pyridoxamine 5'-phosphate oxidase superfamily)
MLNYSRERAGEMLKATHTAILATNGLAGVQMNEFPYEAIGLDIYVLVPRTSDHLFNLEHDDRVALHTAQCEIIGKGQVLKSKEKWPKIPLVPKTETSLYILIKIILSQIQVLRTDGWGPSETIDLTPFQ